MRKKWKWLKNGILLHVLIWCGTKLGYEVVDLYVPDEDLGDGAPVKAIHFAESEWDLKKSMQSFLDGEKDA